MNFNKDVNLVLKIKSGGRNTEDAVGGGRNIESLIYSLCFCLKISRVYVFCLVCSQVRMLCDEDHSKLVPESTYSGVSCVVQRQ